MSDYKFVWPLSDRHLVEMGKVIVESASLEQILQLAIWQILKLPEEQGSHLTGRMHLDARADLFKKLALTVFTADEDKQAIEEVMSAIKDVIPKRNDVAHGLWWRGEEISTSADLYRYKEQGGEYQLRYKSLTPCSIRQYAVDISAANYAIIDFLNERDVAPPPPPRKPPTPY